MSDPKSQSRWRSELRPHRIAGALLIFFGGFGCVIVPLLALGGFMSEGSEGREVSGAELGAIAAAWALAFAVFLGGALLHSGRWRSAVGFGIGAVLCGVAVVIFDVVDEHTRYVPPTAHVVAASHPHPARVGQPMTITYTISSTQPVTNLSFDYEGVSWDDLGVTRAAITPDGGAERECHVTKLPAPFNFCGPFEHNATVTVYATPRVAGDVRADTVFGDAGPEDNVGGMFIDESGHLIVTNLNVNVVAR